MKKAEAISILATSVRPREAKDRARYDEAVKMAIEALEQPEPCEDTISRQAAIREYQEICKGIKCDECPFLIKVNTEKGSHLITDCKLEAFLHDLPSVTPERKTGKWEIYIISMLDGEGCRCSECGFEGASYWDFCPNCGADMRDEQNVE